MIVLLGAIALAVFAFTGRWDRASVKRVAPRTVVLYTSVDDPIAQAVADRFREEMGIIVQIVGDTEATKTTGLVQRLEAEKDAPKADVWWSSEPLGTVLLARRGVLAPMESPLLDSDQHLAWPTQYKSADGTWHAIAQRARVIAYNSKWVKSTRSPTTLRDLANPDWKGRVGMARPQFGTTRTQMAALLSQHGPEVFRRWLEALKANDVRLYDGNSAVTRALGMGEIDVGLVDTDDVWAAQRNAWSVAMNYEAHEVSADSMASTPEESPGGALAHHSGASAAAAPTMPGLGPLAIPNTVAIVKGGPHPREARVLAEFLLSARTEAMLSQMEQHTQPIRPWLASTPEMRSFVVPPSAPVNWDKVADAVPEAMKICEEVLGQ